MTYRAGDFIELANGKTVRLTAETAEIANAAARSSRRIILDVVNGNAEELGEFSTVCFSPDDMYGEAMPDFVEVNDERAHTFYDALNDAAGKVRG